MGRGHPAERARRNRLGHERKLRTAHDDRSAPHPHAFRLGLLEQLLPGLQRIGDRLLAPDMLAGRDGLAIEMLVLLHVGQVDQQVELGAGQHLVDVRVVVGNMKLLGAAARPARE